MKHPDAKVNDKFLLAFLWAAVASFVAGLVAAAWPQYWVYLAAETTPLAWLESVLLALVAFVCGLLAYAESAGGRGTAVRWWLLLTAGFALLALDERFAVHERLRDNWLKATGIRLLPWMEAGDWLIPLYAACGLVMAWGILRLLSGHRPAKFFFAAALLLAGIAAGMDTVDIRSLGKGTERLLQSVEEIIETAAMLSFLSAFLLRLTGMISRPRDADGKGGAVL